MEEGGAAEGAGMETGGHWIEVLTMHALVGFSILLIIIFTVFTLSPAWKFTLYVADVLACAALAWEYFYKLVKAASKRDYFLQHNFEILAATPVIIFSGAEQYSFLAIFLRATHFWPEIIAHFKATQIWLTLQRRLRRNHSF